MSDADGMTHDEWIHDKMIHDEMTHDVKTYDKMTHDYAAADSDQVAADGESDSDRHDGDGEMTTICSDDGNDVAAVLFDSSNSIYTNCMDSHTYSKLHHDLGLCQKARCMNSMSSTPIKQSKSFSYLLLFIMFWWEVKIQPAELKIQSCFPI